MAAESGILSHLFQGANLMADNEKMKQIEQIMRDPMALEPTEYEERIRRNLLIISCLSVMVWWFGATPSGHLEIWGLSFEHLDVRALAIVALSITGYQLLHYGWVIWNKFSYWRVRLTGVRLPLSRGSQAGFSSSSLELADYSGDERNSNLYVWMIEQTPRFNALLDSLNVQHESLQALINKASDSNSSANIGLNEKIGSIEKTTIQLISELNSVRVSESLKRFDSWFHMMVLSQSIRWFALDLFFPLVIGVTAVVALLFMIVGSSDYPVSKACLPLFDNSLI